jgi:hypothetical protein
VKKFRGNSVALLGLLVSAALVSSQAHAQSVRPLQLFVDRPLQFGLVTGSGSVTITPDLSGSRRSLRGLTLVDGLPVSSAIIRAVGEPNAAISFIIDDLDRVTSSQGGSLSFSFEEGLPAPVQLTDPANGSAGTYTFYLGGTVDVRGTEPGGQYAGQVSVNASYN